MNEALHQNNARRGHETVLTEQIPKERGSETAAALMLNTQSTSKGLGVAVGSTKFKEREHRVSADI
jgi:hypothetical protein